MKLPKAVTATMYGTITLERRCYRHSYIYRPTRGHRSDDGDTPGDRGDPDPLWDRTLHRRPERDQPRPADSGGHRSAPCRRPCAPWGRRPLLGCVARRPRGSRDAHGWRALRDLRFVALLQREAGPYRQGGDDRRGWHRKEPPRGELFGVGLRARRALAGRARLRPGGDRLARRS